MAGTYDFDPATADEVRERFAALGAAWWIAGGVALDLHIGRVTRPHGDIDVAIMRGAEPGLRRALPGWDIKIADSGAFLPWDGGPLTPPHHQFWARPSPEAAWALEVLVEDDDGPGRWRFRKDARISRVTADLGATTADGMPYLRPEVCLLYKGYGPPQEKAERDFATVLPSLDGGARAWLGAALGTVDPAHPWIARLR